MFTVLQAPAAHRKPVPSPTKGLRPPRILAWYPNPPKWTPTGWEKNRAYGRKKKRADNKRLLRSPDAGLSAGLYLLHFSPLAGRCTWLRWCACVCAPPSLWRQTQPQSRRFLPPVPHSPAPPHARLAPFTILLFACSTTSITALGVIHNRQLIRVAFGLPWRWILVCYAALYPSAWTCQTKLSRSCYIWIICRCPLWLSPGTPSLINGPAFLGPK